MFADGTTVGRRQINHVGLKRCTEDDQSKDNEPEIWVTASALPATTTNGRAPRSWLSAMGT